MPTLGNRTHTKKKRHSATTHEKIATMLESICLARDAAPHAVTFERLSARPPCKPCARDAQHLKGLASDLRAETKPNSTCLQNVRLALVLALQSCALQRMSTLRNRTHKEEAALGNHT